MRLSTARDVGASLREARLAAGLTQRDAANAAGVGREWIVAVEAGHERAELGKVLRLAEAVGLSLELRPTGQAREDETALDDALRGYRRELPRSYGARAEPHDG